MSKRKQPKAAASSSARPSPHPYDALTPDVVIAAVESLELLSDGRLLALNSYENRVYQVGMELGKPVIVKFYRPNRWSTPAILEEHQFAIELARAELPVVAPMQINERSLFEYADFRFAVFPRQGGHWPELNTEQDREQMGRMLGRMHAIGKRQRFEHRLRLSVDALGEIPRDRLLDDDWIPEHLLAAYTTITDDLLARVRDQIENLTPTSLRIHGDCHPGNVLWTDDGPHFVDLDDCLMGPAIQDVWMLLSGTRHEMSVQLTHLLKGYSQFADFDYAELGLIECLRTLRMIHYAGWLATRWQDPAFPRAFPWFAEVRYWEQHVLALREQLSALDEGPITLM